MPTATQQLVPAVDRAVRMLNELRSGKEGKRISDLARDLDIPKSSAFQIAVTLVHHGLLECDDDTRRYRLGQGLRHLAGARQGRADLPLLAAFHLEKLAAETGLTALLGVPSSSGTVLAAKADSPEPLGIGAPLGYRLHRKAGAFGKVFAAALDGAELEAFLEGLPGFTERSMTDAATYQRDLERVRHRGYATDMEEYLEGVRAVAAPVRDAAATVVGALCVLGLRARLKRDRLSEVAEAVTSAAAALSEDVGYRGPEEGS